MLGETMRRQNKPRQSLEPHFILLDRMKEHDELVHLTLMQDHVILIVTTILGQSGTYPRCSGWVRVARNEAEWLAKREQNCVPDTYAVKEEEQVMFNFTEEHDKPHAKDEGAQAQPQG